MAEFSDDALANCQLDYGLVGWGYYQRGSVSATGFGGDGCARAYQAGRPTDLVKGQVAYYHPNNGWTSADTGRDLNDSFEYVLDLLGEVLKPPRRNRIDPLTREDL